MKGGILAMECANLVKGERGRGKGERKII